MISGFDVTNIKSSSSRYNKNTNGYGFTPTAATATVKILRKAADQGTVEYTYYEQEGSCWFKLSGVNQGLYSSVGSRNAFDSIVDYGYFPGETVTVYVKQGAHGTPYARQFTMPGRAYDIFIGGTQLTDSNMEGFRSKGLSYDYQTDTLTLNNYIGEMGGMFTGLSVGLSVVNPVLYSKSDLTVNVLGTNRLTCTDDTSSAAICVDGNVRVTGGGTLNLNGGSAWRDQFGIFCTGDTVIDMNGGKVNVTLNTDENAAAADVFGIYGGVQCLNGSLEINILHENPNSPKNCLVSGVIDVNSTASYTLMLGQTASSRTKYTGSDVANADEGYKSMLLTFSHTHSYTVEDKSSAYVAVPATCTTENVYYMSCVCGSFTTEQTFGGDERDAHRWQHVGGRAPTYDAPGYTDYEICTVCGLARNGEELPQLERPTAPPVPTGLAAASNAPGAITVTWDAAEHATRYDVYGMIGGDYVKIGSTAETSYTHTGLTPGESYYYKVVAVNESELGELASAMSAAVSAKPAAEPPATHTVTVVSGTASVSTAAKGTTVTITASVPESKEFDRWEVVKGDITLADASKATTTFVMGDLDVEVKAVFKDIFHTVTVTDGTASVSSATKGTTVTITAAAAPEGKAFDKWEVVKGGITLADATANVTTFVMGDLDVEVKAAYKDLPSEKHSVTVTSGTADKSTAAKGETVTVTASAAPSGKAFDKWEVVKGNITLADVTSTVTTFVIGDLNVEVKAVYRDIGSSGEEGLFGDIDGDGNITAADARLALRMSVDIMHDDGIPFTDKQITAADVDRDGRVTGADARLLLRKAVGLEVLSEGWAGPV